MSLHDETLRLARLTEDLATLSAADATGLTLHAEPTDLAELTRQAVAALAAQYSEAQVEVRVDAGAAVPVHADPGRLTQVITNLLTNAIHYNREGGSVAIAVKLDADHVLLSVADTGVGIAQEDQKHLFERFYRVDKARSREQGGTGLGLSIVKHIVQGHGGTVWVKSEPGKGATFFFTLPQSEK